jgi:hypothetical protein
MTRVVILSSQSVASEVGGLNAFEPMTASVHCSKHGPDIIIRDGSNATYNNECSRESCYVHLPKLRIISQTPLAIPTLTLAVSKTTAKCFKVLYPTVKSRPEPESDPMSPTPR